MYEELIKALCNVSEYDSGYAKLMYDAADAIEELSDIARTTATIIENEKDMRVIAKAPRWIPVTERLPGMYQQCWAACKMEGRENWVIEVQNYGIPYKKNPWGDCALLESGEMQVYAWMPIDQPEPPKEGE